LAPIILCVHHGYIVIICKISKLVLPHNNKLVCMCVFISAVANKVQRSSHSVTSERQDHPESSLSVTSERQHQPESSPICSTSHRSWTSE